MALSRLRAEAAAAAEEAAGRATRRLMAAGLVAALALTGIGFGLAALFLWLSSELGAAPAAALVSLICLSLTLAVALIAQQRIERRRAEDREARRASDAAQSDAEALAQLVAAFRVGLDLTRRR